MIGIFAASVAIVGVMRLGDTRLERRSLEIRSSLESRSIDGGNPESSSTTSDVADDKPSIEQTPKHDHWALMSEYHSRSLAQSQLSFTFAIGAAVVGFILIAVAVITVAIGGFDSAGSAGIQLVAGVVVEAVSALFFSMSNRSRALLADFFDKLRADRQFDEALRLADEIPTEDPVRSRLHAALALEYSGTKIDADRTEAILRTVLDNRKE